MTATVVVIEMAWNATLDTSWTNVTDDVDVSKAATVLTWTRMIGLAVVLFSLALVTTVGNAMVLYAVRTEKRLQTVSNMFIVSLAIADLLVGLLVMPISAAYIMLEHWRFGIVVCQLWIGMDYIASTASILNLLILSMDRYWSVSSPLKYLRQRTRKRALIMISVVWCLASLWLVPVVGWHHITRKGVREVPANVCDTEYATNTTFKVITAFINFYVPLAIMIGLYTKIFIEIRKRSSLEVRQHVQTGSTCQSMATAECTRLEPTDAADLDLAERSSSNVNASSASAAAINGITSTRLGLLHSINTITVMAAAQQRHASTTSAGGGSCYGGAAKRRSTQMTHMFSSADIDEGGCGDSDESLSLTSSSRAPQRVLGTLQTGAGTCETIPEGESLERTSSTRRTPGVVKRGTRVSSSGSGSGIVGGTGTGCEVGNVMSSTAAGAGDRRSTASSVVTTTCRIYFYDETVVDDTTERVHHFIYEKRPSIHQPTQQQPSSSTTASQSQLLLASNELKRRSSITTAVTSATADVSDDDSVFVPEELPAGFAGIRRASRASLQHNQQQNAGQQQTDAPRSHSNSLSSAHSRLHPSISPSPSCRSADDRIAIKDVMRHLNATAAANTTTGSNGSSPGASPRFPVKTVKTTLRGALSTPGVPLLLSSPTPVRKISDDERRQFARLRRISSFGMTYADDDDDEARRGSVGSELAASRRGSTTWALETMYGMVRLSNAVRKHGHRRKGKGRGGQSGGHKKKRRRSHAAAAQSALLRQAMRWRRKIEASKHQMSASLAKEIKAARQLGVIMGAFTVCFFPYFVCFMAVAFCNCIGSDLMTAVTWFGYINSTLNPVLYPLCNSSFRRKFRQMLRMNSQRSTNDGTAH